MKEPRRRESVDPPVKQTNWTIIALLGGLLVLVLIVAYFATRGNSDQDKLTNTEVATSSASTPGREKLCASSRTYDLLKAELFRRASQLRGSDQAAYDRLSSYAVVRMENPVMESEDASTGAVNCSGSLSLDLPPGVAAIGGRRTLMSDVDYTVQQAADGSGITVLLRNADAIITPLATLARVAAPVEPPAQPEENGAATEALPANQVQAAPPASTAPEGAPASTGRPSFSCTSARSKGEMAVCGDAGLAALDRNMATEYGRAFGVASPEERDLLRETGQRFSSYRDRCPDRKCIADAYVGRIREIRDIVEGRWQPSR
jgi:hypothetical protein